MRGDQLLRFLAQRLLKLVLLTFALVVVNFLLIHAAPGDPASVMAGQSGAADERYLAQLREQFGLDRPLAEQLWIYVSRVATLDLGVSHRMQRPVADLILERLPATLLLSVTAFAFAVAAGIAMGAAAATRAGTVWDSLITALSMVFYCTPLFWTGLLLVLLFSVTLNWLPSFGMSTVGADYTGLRAALDVAEHLVLPALTLGLFYLAVYARLTRSSVLEVADQDFVKTARAKGVGEGRILRRHVLRNALLPVVTLAGIQAGHLIGGSILVETVFAWPGIGSLAFDALLQRDYELLLGVFLCTSVIVMLFNLLTDLLYLVIDPRVQMA
ncbi:Oligopeptide transport system permease protein oppB (plasmid) [Roseomonas mucosa]|uniref:Dipeptide transport system permease protein dppB n=1 Tax=Roseomonas mucosa TaxID=207340 RepID=A0A379PLJ0_9PROT|nr:MULTISPECIES: ABC transporter permease [Roseomonas]MBS5904632.1 ABC transporter permease [Acetobacteraceae bacterium]MCG7352607.1 ABC transporter permease [Roseomonas mucosa]MCG7358062.1 ABC transporter permease [Roseomonas mucosa]MDT8292242.1 ABC transporter permease [Roseomonas mucosa]MDT8295514.1 ABC transporter permease [Roseomonas mucosa]